MSDRTAHVLLFRHGETDENARGVLQGQSDTQLNAIGLQQAEALAARLRGFHPRIERLVSSDLTRAVQTAAPIERLLGVDARRDPAWRERGFGAFEGRTVGEADVWRAATGAADLPGAEPMPVFEARVRKALLGVAQAVAPGACVGVVTHGGAIRSVLRHLVAGTLCLAPGASAPDLVAIANCSIMHLHLRQPGATPQWRVECANDVEHLGREGETTEVQGS